MIREALSDAKIHIQENSSNRKEAWSVIKGIDAALTSLDAPFDISKVEGWEKVENDIATQWKCGKYFMVKVFDDSWCISQGYGTGVKSKIFWGKIHTHSFFLALCEGLNIEQQ